MNAKEYEMTDDEYSDLLTEIYGTIDVCGYKHDAGSVLKEIDPIAWDCGKSEQDCGWECGECGARYDDEDEAEECCKPKEEPMTEDELEKVSDVLKVINALLRQARR